MAEVGRPTDYSPEVVTKLASAFQRSMSVLEACQYADITKTTYYRWLEEKPEFKDKIEKSKTFLSRKSKENVFIAINDENDLNTSKWYLEKRDPEFKQKVELDGQVATTVENDDVKELIDLMKKNESDARKEDTESSGSADASP